MAHESAGSSCKVRAHKPNPFHLAVQRSKLNPPSLSANVTIHIHPGCFLGEIRSWVPGTALHRLKFKAVLIYQ